jgi:hypothetical protein
MLIAVAQTTNIYLVLGGTPTTKLFYYWWVSHPTIINNLAVLSYTNSRLYLTPLSFSGGWDTHH